MASCLAVELLVGVLHHPLGARAPADEAQEITEPTESEMGLLPHQIRGFLSHFQNMLLVGHYYDRCTACSARVVDAFRAAPFELVRHAMNDPAYLEQLAGLHELATDIDADGGDDWINDADDDDFDFD